MKKLQIKRWIFPASLILLALVLVTGTATLAKYISTNSTAAAVQPQSFYFESDLLSVEGPTYTVQGNTIAFELYNYADALRYSEANVAYSVTVKRGNEVISLTNATNATGTLTGGARDMAKFSLSGLAAGTYTVSATCSTPFAKTMTATFTLTQNKTVTSSISDDTNVIYLTVTTTDYSGNVNVTWTDANLIPDNTSPYVSNVAANSLTVAAKLNSTYTLVFYKTTATPYATSPFTVTAP